MYVVYNVILIVFTAVLSPVIVLIMALRSKYRCGFKEKCGFGSYYAGPAERSERPIWIHAVSVGEVMAALPLLKVIRQRYPGVPLVLSTVTETGNYTARRNASLVDAIVYFPYDYPFVVKRVVSHISPRAFIMLEAEIWPNLLRELNRHGTPSIIISGRISSSSFKNYHLFRFFFKRVLTYISCFCMQTQTYADRIIRMGAQPERVMVSGNIKFDMQMPAITPVEKKAVLAAAGITEGQRVFIAGSTHRGEEERVLDVYQAVVKQFTDLVLILAPRHPERFSEVENVLQRRAIPYRRKSALPSGSVMQAPNVLLLDTVGELAKTYSIATIVFIGGSLVPVGGHNVLEAAIFSKPALFGPHMDNFSEIARILVEQDAALMVYGTDDFIEHMRKLLEDTELCRRTGENALRVVEQNSGALARSIDVMKDFLDHNRI